MTSKTVSLVLGCGGARSLAHIGAIHYLEENGYDIRSISGCSMGALVGGIYACGELDVFEEWVRAISSAPRRLGSSPSRSASNQTQRVLFCGNSAG